MQMFTSFATRNLTFKGTTLIARNILLAQIGFETEMMGVPAKYKKGQMI
jgi:hypothetical protein